MNAEPFPKSYWAQRYARLKVEGRCPLCTEKVTGRVLCLACQTRCNARSKARREGLRKRGLCQACGKAKSRLAYCPECEQKYRRVIPSRRVPMIVKLEEWRPTPFAESILRGIDLSARVLRKLERRAA